MAGAVEGGKPEPLSRGYRGACVEDNFEFLWGRTNPETATVLGLFLKYVHTVFQLGCYVDVG